MPVRPGQVIAQLAVAEWIRLLAEIDAGLIQGDGVKGGQHADVRQDGGVIFIMAVTVRGYVHDEADMEAGAAMAHRGGVLRDLAAEVLIGGVVDIGDGIEGAGADAAAAALAQVGVDMGFAVLVIEDGVAAALLGTAAAATADGGIHPGGALVMLMHLAGPGAAAHADILAGAAETGGFMALEMGEGDQDIRVHDGAADEGGLAELAVGHGNLHIVRAPETVGDDDMATGGDGVEAVHLGVGQMIDGVLAGTGIEGIAVREEGDAAQLLDQIRHGAGVVRAEKGQIAQLAEGHLDGDKLAGKINVGDASGAAELLELGGEADADGGAEVGKVYFGWGHGDHSSLSESMNDIVQTMGCIVKQKGDFPIAPLDPPFWLS